MNAKYSPLGEMVKEDFSGFLKKSLIGIKGASLVIGSLPKIKIENKKSDIVIENKDLNITVPPILINDDKIIINS